jgi:hypothetical protein
METLAMDFPPGIGYKVSYDATIFVGKSVDEVISTIFVAILLVVAVVFLFLQNWRAAIIPVIAIPVSLVGVFSVLYALGISLNNLSLFGLVIAVGIVVDDVIVVVENVERNIRLGMTPAKAAHTTMDEVGGALISIALTLCAVFVPSAFLSGISGLFFRQFAVTIAASTVISCFVSLTLSPALCAVLFKAHRPAPKARGFGPGRVLRAAFESFNRGFEWLSNAYGRLTRRLQCDGLRARDPTRCGSAWRASSSPEPRRASSRSRTRAISSPSCSCRRAPRSTGPRRSSSEPSTSSSRLGASSMSRPSRGWMPPPSRYPPMPGRSSRACPPSTITRSRA